MSVRKRAWTTSKGEREGSLGRRLCRPGRQEATQDVRKEEGRGQFRGDGQRRNSRWRSHGRQRQQVTIAEAGNLWLETGEQAGLERTTLDAYRQHLRLHIDPYLGKAKLSQLSAPMVRDFEDKLARGDMPEGAAPEPRSPGHGQEGAASLSALLSDAQERGLVSRNVVQGTAPEPRSGARSARLRSASGASSRSGSIFLHPRRDQGHCGGCHGPLEAIAANGDLHRLAGF